MPEKFHGYIHSCFVFISLTLKHLAEEKEDEKTCFKHFRFVVTSSLVLKCFQMLRIYHQVKDRHLNAPNSHISCKTHFTKSTNKSI